MTKADSAPGYDCTKPGTNALDELNRAIHDVVRMALLWKIYAGIFERCITDGEGRGGTQWTNTVESVRALWVQWLPAIDRVAVAHRAAAGELRHLGINADIPAPLGTLQSMFHGPTYLGPEQTAGDHLLSSGGPLHVDNGRSMLQSDRLAQAMDRLDDVRRAILPYADAASLDADAGSAGDADAREWWPANRFSKVAKETIRKASGKDRKSKRVRSKRIDGVKVYCVDDVRKWFPTLMPRDPA